MDVFIIASLPPILGRGTPTAGPLCSAGITPLLRSYGPLRHPLAFRPISRCCRLWGHPFSGDFAPGPGGLLQLRDPSLPPCRRYHPAGVDQPPQPDFRDCPCCLRATTVRSASGLSHFRGHLCVRLRYRLGTRSPSRRWLCQWASGHRFPSSLPSKLRGSGFFPDRTNSC